MNLYAYAMHLTNILDSEINARLNVIGYALYIKRLDSGNVKKDWMK
jgi:hypothetical protein